MKTAVFILLLCALAAHAIPIRLPHSSQKLDAGIIYQAENAFKNAPQELEACQLQHDDVSGTVVGLTEGSYVIFTVNIPEDGFYPVSLFGFSCSAQVTSVDISANGLPLFDRLRLDLSERVTVHELQLRAGLNTIKYQVFGGNVAFDYISVKGGIPMAVNGATVNYEEIEAESASYQGQLIGPGRQYCTLPSEASGRQAVQLTALGNYVEFSPTQSFNAIVVRFSIPNTNDGVGQAADLNLFINGALTAQLNVTSYFSWTYGSYPFFRVPGQGNPHHFYDDVRYAFNTTYPAGTKVRLIGGSPVEYTIDLADFYTIPAPYTQPGGYVSVTDHGADPTGNKDSGGAFQEAIQAAVSAGQGVWIPQGKYIFSYRLNCQNKLTVRGAGPWYTELHGHDFGFDGQGNNNIGLYDFAVIGQTNVRVDSEVSSGVGSALSNSVAQNLWIEHDKCGMWLDGPFDSFLITGVTIRNTFADGINFHLDVTNSMVEQTVIRNTGDDCLAMWPQNSNNYGSNVFRFNSVSIPVLANTIAIYGGSNNSATDNYCADTVVEGAGLQTGTRFSSTPLSGQTTFQRNTLVRCGSPDMYNPSSTGEGSIWLYPDSGNIDTPVLFEDISITDSYYQAVMFYQGQVSNINFTNIQVTNANILWQELVSGTIYAQGVVASNITDASIWNCGPQFTINQGSGNSGWSTTSTKCN